jgi:hypothetical protein
VEEQKWRVFENRPLRGIFEAKRVELTGSWRKLNSEECRCMYSSKNTNIIR